MALGCLPALLALWVRRCRDLGRLNIEAIVSFFLVFSASIFSPLASGGVFFEIPVFLGKMLAGLFLVGTISRRYLRCGSVDVWIWVDPRPKGS